MQAEPSFIESVIHTLYKRYKEYKAPFLTAVIVGLIAHGFSFTNKLVQQDDLSAFYGKGASLSSGRWMLKAISIIMPDYSMPWIYGILSIFFFAITVVIIIHIFQIKNKWVQILFAGLFVSFPAITGLFTLPFVVTPNALAILLSTTAVYCFTGESRWGKIACGIALLIISLGIYQAYITLASSLLVVWLLKSLVCDEKPANDVFKRAVVFVGLLAISLLGYGLITLVINAVTNTELLSYAYSQHSLLIRFRVAYTAFAGIFYKGYFSFINSKWSLGFHIIGIALTGLAFCSEIKSLRDKKAVLLAVLLFILLPLSINAMYLASSPDVLGPIVFVGFISVYLLAMILAENLKSKLHANWEKAVKDGIALCFVVVIVSNTYFSNEVYLKMYMQTSQLTSFYTGIMTQVMAEPEYDGTQTLVILGDPSDLTYSMDEIDTTNFIGLCSENVYDLYTRYNFIKYYLGYDINFATFNEECNISGLQEYQDMPVYPASGAIKIMDQYIVVKLSN